MAKRKTLKQIRKAAGLTQEQAADKLNISHDTISRWEAGSTQPTAKQVADLCKLYGVQFEDINWEPKHND